MSPKLPNSQTDPLLIFGFLRTLFKKHRDFLKKIEILENVETTERSVAARGGRWGTDD